MPCAKRPCGRPRRWSGWPTRPSRSSNRSSRTGASTSPKSTPSASPRTSSSTCVRRRRRSRSGSASRSPERPVRRRSGRRIPQAPPQTSPGSPRSNCSRAASLDPLEEHRAGRGDLVPVQKPLQYPREVAHPAALELGVCDPHLESIVREAGLYLEYDPLRGEEDVGEDGLGGDGEVVEPPPAQPGHGTPPGDEVASLSGAGEIRRNFLLVGRLHALRLQRKPTGVGFV